MAEICGDIEALLARASPADLESNLQFVRKSLHSNQDALELLDDRKRYLLPFKVVDELDDKPFLACNYNKVADGYRSPWTNTIHTLQKDRRSEKQPVADSRLRPLELTMNEVWNAYTNLYYGHSAVGSVFLTDKEGVAFEGCFGIQKKCSVGTWNSASLVVAGRPDPNGECEYKVETTVCLVLNPLVEGTSVEHPVRTKATISSLVTKTASRRIKTNLSSKLPINATHIEHVGTLIETNEIDLRSSLEKVLIPKNKETIDAIQQESVKTHRPQVNPLMGMMMDSEILKKRLAKSSD